jgi:hypothetical protein
MSQPLGMVIKGFKTGCNKAYRQALSANACPAMPQQCCSKEDSRAQGFLFSRNYNDHILDRAGELDRWFKYLADNPRRLAIKRQKPEYFTILSHVNIGEWSCQTIGNQFLLSYPEKAAVIVHRACSDKEYEEQKSKWLALAARGGVLISAAIATREKEVMREAMNRGYHHLTRAVPATQ